MNKLQNTIINSAFFIASMAVIVWSTYVIATSIGGNLYSAVMFIPGIYMLWMYGTVKFEDDKND